VLVVATEGCGILVVGLSGIGAGEDGEEVRTGGKGIAVEKLLHLGLDSDLEALTGLATLINQTAMSDIFTTKVSEIDKGEPTRTETKDERVACESEFLKHAQEGPLTGVLTQTDQTGSNIKRAEVPDETGRDGTLLGMGDGGTDKGEGLSVGYQPLADSLVIDGLEIAHVEDCCVALNATVQKPLLIGYEQFDTDTRQRDVMLVKGFQITAEAVAAVKIILSQTELIPAVETGNF
jgi:hypothetical protein